MVLYLWAFIILLFWEQLYNGKCILNDCILYLQILKISTVFWEKDIHPKGRNKKGFGSISLLTGKLRK